MERKRASDFPQELLNLFDQYVHGGISRRAFLDGAQNFAVGGVTATALFEMLKPNYAWAVQVPEQDSRIVAKFATVPSPKGNGNIRGYLVEPRNATTKLPVVLVIHENRGLNPYVVALGEGHLRRILQSYARYYNELRTHRSLNKDAPIHRAIESLGAIISRPVLGGLHRRYCRI